MKRTIIIFILALLLLTFFNDIVLQLSPTDNVGVRVKGYAAKLPDSKLKPQPEKGLVAVGNHKYLELAGIPQSDWGYIDFIFNSESGWCWSKWQNTHECINKYTEPFGSEAVNNPVIGYGLCQSTPAIKMAQAGSDWQTNILTQIKWCDLHAKATYGSWEASYYRWIKFHNW